MSCSACISLYQYVTCTVLFCMHHYVPVRHMHVYMSCSTCISLYPGADPGFGIRGCVSRRGIWGPFKVPSGSRSDKNILLTIIRQNLDSK
jgi:hypothetical protein